MSELLLKSSDLLIECVQSNDSQKRVELYKEIKELEREGDRWFQTVFDELGKSFITPFDREDIHQLAGYIDDVADGINSSAKRIAIYNRSAFRLWRWIWQMSSRRMPKRFCRQ